MQMDSFISIHIFTGNNIGAEGAKLLGEVMKHNTFLTTLDLGCMKNLIFRDFVDTNGLIYSYGLTANNIGFEGSKGWRETLKQNVALTTLDLGCMKENDIYDFVMQMDSHIPCVKVIILVVKELKFWVKH